MRKIVFCLLLAGAASPALAAAPRWHDDGNDKPARQENRAERPARGGYSAEQARPSFQRPSFQAQSFQAPAREQRFAQPQFGGYARAERPAEVERAQPAMRYNPYAAQNRGGDAGDSVRDWRPRQLGGQAGGYVQQVRPNGANGYPQYGRGYDRTGYSGGYSAGGRMGAPMIGSVPRQGAQAPFRVDNRRIDQQRWNTNWRNDRRYDWRDRRRYNSSLFHIGLYVDPFGWDYQPYSIGYRLWPDYYQQNYWIDPAMYGLPYAPPGLQWVRYWNDALLVDTFSGEVVDSIPGFFW